MDRNKRDSGNTQAGWIRKLFVQIGCSLSKRQFLVGIASFSVFVVAVFYFIPPVTVGVMLADAGYLVIVPPSTFHGPGTLNTVERLSDNSVKLHPTCEIDVNEISSKWKMSSTVDHEITERLSSGFSIQSNLVDKSKSLFSGEQVRDVRLSMKNIKILLLPHESLLELQKKYVKGSCEEAIFYNLSNGADVCQTEAVLQADMIYTIVFNEGVDVDQKEKVTQEFTASLEGGGERIAINELKGKNLFYGIKLSKMCLTLNEPMIAQQQITF